MTDHPSEHKRRESDTVGAKRTDMIRTYWPILTAAIMLIWNSANVSFKVTQNINDIAATNSRVATIEQKMATKQDMDDAKRQLSEISEFLRTLDGRTYELARHNAAEREARAGNDSAIKKANDANAAADQLHR